MKNIFKLFFNKNGMDEQSRDYYFFKNLSECEYPKYLKKIYKYKTGENLNLKHPKTFNEKIQWIKLYGVTDLMRDCTDKVKVRDYVKERIGEEYLKPVLQIIPNESHKTMHFHCEQVNDNLGLARQSTDRSNDTPDCRADIKMSSSARLRFPKFQFRENRVLAEYNDRALVFKDNDNTTYFDKIDFDKLPDSFVIKTNHGCKWQYIIKNKKEYLKNKRLIKISKKQITGWLEQDYSFCNGFELQYGNIEPKILIEPLLREDINTNCKEIHVYVCNNLPKYIIKIHNANGITIYDENLHFVDEIFSEDDKKIFEPADALINQAFYLSKQLSKEFTFVRVDWMIYQNKLYFEELTFTPYSGFHKFLNKKLVERISFKLI